MKCFNSLVAHLRKAVQGAREQLFQVRAAARTWWATHRERLAAEESGYADAFVAVLLAVVALITENARVRYVAFELAAAYIAVIRAFRPDYGEAFRWRPAHGDHGYAHGDHGYAHGDHGYAEEDWLL